MGLLSWLFPSKADRIAKAREMLANGEPAMARLEVSDWADEAEVAALIEECERALCRLNLESAKHWGEAGDPERALHHMTLAERFTKPGMEAEVRAVRTELRETRDRQTTAQKRAEEERQSRLSSVDPLGMWGDSALSRKAGGADPLSPDDEERRQRVALLLENYPKKFRDQVPSLGPVFAQAVLDLDDGRADLALPVLLTLPEESPLVHWERARAAMVYGDGKASVRHFKAAVERAGGHFAVANLHTATCIAELQAQMGQHDEALRVLRSARASEPKLGGPLFAALLAASGALPEAEQVLMGLVRDYPTSSGLYVQLAEIRAIAGHRDQALVALEAGLRACDCTPGKCGSQPKNAGMVRMAATLYLEDRPQDPRGLELADEVKGMVQKPGWEDVYVVALAGRRRREPGIESLVDKLHEATDPEDPRWERLDKFLPAAGA